MTAISVSITIVKLLEVKREQQLKTNNFLLIKALIDVRKTDIEKIKEQSHNTRI